MEKELAFGLCFVRNMLVLLSEVVIGIGGTVVLILSRFKLCFETGTKVERFIGIFIELELIGFTINPED